MHHPTSSPPTLPASRRASVHPSSTVSSPSFAPHPDFTSLSAPFPTTQEPVFTILHADLPTSTTTTTTTITTTIAAATSPSRQNSPQNPPHPPPPPSQRNLPEDLIDNLISYCIEWAQSYDRDPLALCPSEFGSLTDEDQNACQSDIRPALPYPSGSLEATKIAGSPSPSPSPSPSKSSSLPASSSPAPSPPFAAGEVSGGPKLEDAFVKRQEPALTTIPPPPLLPNAMTRISTAMPHGFVTTTNPATGTGVAAKEEPRFMRPQPSLVAMSSSSSSSSLSSFASLPLLPPPSPSLSSSTLNRTSGYRATTAVQRSVTRASASRAGLSDQICVGVVGNGGSGKVQKKGRRARAPARAWSDDEHKRFEESLELYGRNWERCAAHIGTRSTQLVRSHAQKYLIKLWKLNRPLPKKLAESGTGYTLSGKPLLPDSASARSYLTKLPCPRQVSP